MLKCLQVTVCHLMSNFLIQSQNIFCRTYTGTICFARVTRMLVAFLPSFYNLKTHFLSSCAYLLSALLYNWYYWQRNAYYFYNMPEMRITFVLLSLMADKHVNTCDTNITLFSVKINYHNSQSSLPSISITKQSKCSEENYTLSSLVFRLASIQPPCCNLMQIFCLPLTTYVHQGTRKGVSA